MRVYLVRHAAVLARYEGKYNGWIDIPIDPDRFEPKSSIEALSGVGFAAVYSSDLSRCVQTANILGYSPVLDTRLREKSFGRGEGLGYDEICERFGLVYDGFESFIEGIGGESLSEFFCRVDDFLSQKKASYPDKEVLIFTHSGVIRYILSKVKNISLEEAFCIKIPYGSVTVVTL